MYRPIADYALIGNTRCAALVSSDASIDWCCLPRFDGPAVFFRLLDHAKGGYCAIRPRDVRSTRRAYIPETNILETIFATSSGELTVIDFMPLRRLATETIRGEDVVARPRIIRLLKCSRGSVEGEIELRAGFDFGAREPEITVHDSSADLRSGRQHLRAQLPSRPVVRDGVLASKFRLQAGESACVVLTYAAGEPVATLSRDDVAKSFDNTLRYWKEWSRSCEYDDDYRDVVLRSALTLKALIFEPTGAIIAAPTTSLPEWIGGQRNWDYRYTWIRDSSLTLGALMNLGYFGEARDFFRFLHRVLPGDPADYQILYGIGGERDLHERNLDSLDGYRGSRPVRLGNGAVRQTQLDIYGELAHCIFLYWKHPGFRHQGEHFARDHWPMLRACANYIAANWPRKGSGIWEMRGGEKQHTYSKGMCWVVLDRALKLAGDLRVAAPERHEWEIERQRISEELRSRGFNDQVNAFTQTYGSEMADAATLRMPMLGIVEDCSPRMLGTVRLVEKQLLRNGLVYRYRQSDDGVGGEEGTFTACGFWLAENYMLQGRLEEAERLFRHILSYANDVGLMSEEINPDTGELLGNFPQGFTHIGLINAAVRLHKARSGRKTGAQAILAGER